MYSCVLMAICCFTFQSIKATEIKKEDAITTTFEIGELVLETFLEACPSISNAKPSNRIQAGTLGEIVNCNGNLYEIRVNSFEDTTGKIPPNISFLQYASKNNLLEMKSHKVFPLPSIVFECFDFRHARLNDGVYFSIVMREKLKINFNKGLPLIKYSALFKGATLSTDWGNIEANGY